MEIKKDKKKKEKKSGERPQWNTSPGRGRHARDKPFTCLQCPSDFQPVVSEETCCVPESIHQSGPESKTMWGEGKREGGGKKKEDSSSPRGRVDRLSQGRCLSLRKVAPFLPQPGMKRQKGFSQGTGGQMWCMTVAELPAY